MTALAAAAGLQFAMLLSADWTPARRPLPSVSLVRHDGDPTTLDEGLLRDRIVAINFLFTSCKVFCPAAAHTFARVQKDLAGKPVHLLSISVDPERDTPRALSRFAAAAGADLHSNWTLVTGGRTSIDTVLALFQGMTDSSPENHSRGVIVWNGPARTWTWIPESNAASKIEALLQEALSAAGGPASK